MIFPDEKTERSWVSLTQEKHARLAKARAVAIEAAWRDLPTNEQARYIELAYQAVKAEERTN